MSSCLLNPPEPGWHESGVQNACRYYQVTPGAIIGRSAQLHSESSGEYPQTRGFVYMCCVFNYKIYLPYVVVDSIENLRRWVSFEEVFLMIK
jgi:hypothetical protein